MHPIDGLAPIALCLLITGLTCMLLWDPIVNRIRRRRR